MDTKRDRFIKLTWDQNGISSSRDWIVESDVEAPKEVRNADERLTTEEFSQAASRGVAFVWQGDFHKAKDLLNTLNRLLGKKAQPRIKSRSLLDEFQHHRQTQSERARILSRLLIPVDKNGRIPLKRAPDVSIALQEAMILQGKDFLLSLRELLGLIGAHEWRKKGIPIPALGASIHPYYGVFSPARGEYLELINEAPLPKSFATAFDIGTGTGVIAALLAKRGSSRIIATDLDPRALACARENLKRLGYDKKVEVVQADLFPSGQADLIVCNPPWLPGRPTAPIERAIYDEESGMLRGFLKGAAAHLNPNGEAWLIISDLAEIIGLRGPNDLENWITEGGLTVLGRLTTRPRHGKASDTSDPLFQARSQEITSLWRLGR